ncbi:MAG: HAD family hydrolase [Lachnospiraceae bacterium]|nr:HAD family hydrolase [Lachnospiraceae bacterium]
MKDYANYIFDLYATLVDIHTDETKPELWERSAAYLRRFGLLWHPQLLRAAYLKLCRQAEAALRREMSLSHVEIDLLRVFETLLLTAPGTCPADTPVTPENVSALAAQFALFFRETSREYLYPYPATQPFLAGLRARGRRIFLLSNAQACFTRAELAQCGLADAFDAVYLSSDHRMKKPEPRFLQKLLTEQHLRPEDSVFIGNDIDTDIALAQACGLDSVYLNTLAWSRRKIRAHVRMHSLDLSKITMIDSGDLSEWKA